MGFSFEEFPLNIDFYIPNIFSKSVFNGHKVTKKTKARFLFSFVSLWFIHFIGFLISDFDPSIACIWKS